MFVLRNSAMVLLHPPHCLPRHRCLLRQRARLACSTCPILSATTVFPSTSAFTTAFFHWSKEKRRNPQKHISFTLDAQLFLTLLCSRRVLRGHFVVSVYFDSKIEYIQASIRENRFLVSGPESVAAPCLPMKLYSL